MKKYLYLLFAAFVAVGLSACSPDDNEPDVPGTEIPDTPDNPNNPDDGNDPDNPKDPDTPNPTGKTLVAYYSYTNNVERIVTELRSQIEADVVEIEPKHRKVLIMLQTTMRSAHSFLTRSKPIRTVNHRILL
ncbi:hypothetical protein NXX77_23430 [Phocaeicola dorei]|nr:hypothetical protein [Phocaeicola dorei]